MSRRRPQAIAAVLAALPALILAAAGWLTADAKAKEASKAWDGYGEYVTDQLHRDEALLKALRECERDCGRTWHDLAAAEGPVAAYRVPDSALGAPQPEVQAQTVLDEVARREGWKP